ncbi:hypothetical protein BV25DRAFT_1913669 [Artomyces pyxidatus]|uniref:Uncharacterized protein n=1 Tax=Artomyces pyxidatus TaxID=48021 RepID=A0ACB8TBV1_9AGAM|nr:hypothetical protein BV25DRAFT_1913669 [Artomyces pyxidatus]
MTYGHGLRHLEKAIMMRKAPLKKKAQKYLSEARKKFFNEAQEAEIGPEANESGTGLVTIDAFHFRHWDLMTTASFYTWPHHDANGLCTWASVRDGCKFWGIVRFKSNKVASCKKLQKDFELFVIVLEPGSTIIMPPGAWHVVYTPINTIITGGHLLSYNTFHLTQWSRKFDSVVEEASNADHVGMRRTIARMALALKYLR